MGQSHPPRTYVSNVQTGRSQFLKVTKIFVEIRVFNVGILKEGIDGSVIFLYYFITGKSIILLTNYFLNNFSMSILYYYLMIFNKLI